MKKSIGKFFAKVCQTLLMWCIEWEIYHQISPHLNKEKNNGYLPIEEFDQPSNLEGSAYFGHHDFPPVVGPV